MNLFFGYNPIEIFDRSIMLEDRRFIDLSKSKEWGKSGNARFQHVLKVFVSDLTAVRRQTPHTYALPFPSRITNWTAARRYRN